MAGKLESAAVALKEAGDRMLQSDDFTEEDIIAVLTECLELTVSVEDKDTLGKPHCLSVVTRRKTHSDTVLSPLPQINS